MAYTTSTEVIALTGSSLSSSIVDSIISIADGDIDAQLAREGLTISGATPPDIAMASLYLSAALVLERQRVDGTLPDSARVGDMQLSQNIEATIKRYREMAAFFLRAYIAKQKGEDYYTTFTVASIDWTDKA